MTPKVAAYCQGLIEVLLEQKSPLNDGQLSAMGVAARNVLRYAWAASPRNSRLVTHAIRSVCRTFDTDPTSSASLLRQGIESKHLQEYGFEEMPIIARESKYLSLLDPGLVADVYEAVFTYDESSTDKTAITDSNILSLTSNKRQDYEHAKWQLAENYPDFVAGSPIAGATVMVKVMNAYAKARHRYSETSPTSLPFDVGNSATGMLVTDYSHVWDTDYGPVRDDELRILDAFFRQLNRHVQAKPHDRVVDEVLDVLMVGERPAIAWRRLLQLGAQYPEVLLPRLKPLAWAEPLLDGFDTSDLAADFVAAVFTRLSTDDRRRVERAIFSIATRATGNLRVYVERRRDELLRRLSYTDLVTAEAKALAERLPEQSLSSTSSANLLIDGARSVVPDEETEVAVSGETAQGESTKVLLDLKRHLESFNAEHRNNAISAAQIEAAVPKLQAYRSALETTPKDAEAGLANNSWGVLAESCKIVANSPELLCPGPASIFLQNTLIELSKHPVPEHDPTIDASFDKAPSWGGPLPRIEAAIGLMLLARRNACCDDAVLNAIEALARDPAPQVRFQAACYLALLQDAAPDPMWELFERRAEIETSKAVLAVLAQSIGSLARREPDSAFRLAKVIFERAYDGPGKDDARRNCIHTFLELTVWRDHKPSAEFLYRLLEDVRTNLHEADVILFALRPIMTHDDSGVRARAVQLFSKTTAAVCAAFEAIFTQIIADGGQNTTGELFDQLAKSVHCAAREVLFASGVRFDGQTQKERLTLQQERFYSELSPTIDRLVHTGLSPAIYHLGQMLEAYVSLHPSRVFLQIATAVESGKRWNYQYESLAADLIVRVVERYLAEQRSLLQEDVDCRTALRNTLDAFVQAGWPSAQRLAYRLDEIFR
jgi:hypothetical protein